MADSRFLKVAKKAAIEAGKIVKEYYQSKLELNSKGHFSNFATQADLESEGKAIEIIKANFPDHNIVAEESGTVYNNSEYSWVIDPIDGTIPFVDGISTFGVSVGLLKNEKPFVGVINMVAQNEIFWAEEGLGAFKDGQQIKVRPEKSLEKSTMAMEFGHEGRAVKLEKQFGPIVEKVRAVYVFGSAVKDLTSVAEGNLDACFLQAHPWDFAAGAILVLEAGGKVSSPDGKEPEYLTPTYQLICSNGLIHEDLVKVYN